MLNSHIQILPLTRFAALKYIFFYPKKRYFQSGAVAELRAEFSVRILP
jgi:hypothetical protein